MTARAMLLVTLTLMAGLTLAIPAHGATSSPPSQVISTPVAHDDEHTDRSAPGANPAFWILSVAVLCLVAIALIMVRAGRAPRAHLSRGAPPGRPHEPTTTE